MQKQITSKQRVADHGEVFTNEQIVNDMLDLVEQETERIDSRFLEPACGTGNFLAEILHRKLKVVERNYRRSQHDFELNLVTAVSSIYGIDILEDNVIECRKRLCEIADERYNILFKNKAREIVRKVIRNILNKNIIWGDALTLCTVGPDPHQIIFTEWAFLLSGQVKRRDFVFAELFLADSRKKPDLFSNNIHISDLGEPEFIPTETFSYPLVHFLKVGEEHA